MLNLDMVVMMVGLLELGHVIAAHHCWKNIFICVVQISYCVLFICVVN